MFDYDITDNVIKSVILPSLEPSVFYTDVIVLLNLVVP